MLINCDKCKYVFTKRTKLKTDRTCNKCKKVIKNFQKKHGCDIPTYATSSHYRLLQQGIDTFIKIL